MKDNFEWLARHPPILSLAQLVQKKALPAHARTPHGAVRVQADEYKLITTTNDKVTTHIRLIHIFQDTFSVLNY